MIFHSPYNPNPHLTVKERQKMSLPTKVLFEKKRLNGTILDFGCGLGKDVELLSERGFNVSGYDPYYFKDIPQGKFDTIIVNYVLNVLLQEEQAHVIMAVSELLKDDGYAYYAVRRDIKRNGFIFNPKKNARTYQCNVVLPFKSIFRTEYSEIYEYRKFINQPGQTSQHEFFRQNINFEFITESARAISIFAPNPISKGHAMVFSKRNVAGFPELNNQEQNACLIMTNRILEKLKRNYNPNQIKVVWYGMENDYPPCIQIIPEYNS
jgi:SAM-dependent methyltransferase